jgi:hypothetical protein
MFGFLPCESFGEALCGLVAEAKRLASTEGPASTRPEHAPAAGWAPPPPRWCRDRATSEAEQQREADWLVVEKDREL